MSEPHTHSHDGPGHVHPPAADHVDDPELVLIERAVRELLIEQGLFAAADVRREIEAMESRSPAGGAKMIARAWVDPDYKRLLLSDTRAASAAMCLDLTGFPDLMVMEDTPTLHHVVVCTLCSCYPRGVLGIPPAWYKSPEYRSRVVADPRGVLAEFGTELGSGVEVRVVDSTADLRYMVLPVRPAGTEGWAESRLAEIVSRDSLIGVALPRLPS